MMARVIPRGTLVCLLVLSLTRYTNQNVRKKREIDPQLPRLYTLNGNLVIAAASNRNITFTTAAGGSIFVDNIDLKNSVAQGASNLTRRMTSLETTVSSMGGANQNMRNLIRALSRQFASYSANQNSLTERLTTAENQASATQQSLTQLQATVQTLQNRMNRLAARVTALENISSINECLSNPCHNGGTCSDLYNGFFCRCPSNFKGATCSQDVNECVELAGSPQGCQNGATCLNTHGGFTCQCTANFRGVHCAEQHDDCTGASSAELCGHGVCMNEPRRRAGRPNYHCICEPGWTTSGSDPACTVDVNECQTGQHRCSRNPPVPCINTPGSSSCGNCPAGYEGDGFTCSDINECNQYNGGCSQNPRVDCTNTRGSRTCGPCPAGYQGNGVQCIYTGAPSCTSSNGGCHPLATCSITSDGATRICTCPTSYVGTGVGPNGCQHSSTVGCASTPCLNGARCMSLALGNFRCVCQGGYTGTFCDTLMDPCASTPCQNGGTCTSSGTNSYNCECTSSYTGDQCQTEQETCGEFLNAESGSFSYPHEDSSDSTYRHLSTCAWVITTSINKILHVTFPTFHIEGGSGCPFDFLQIHDGASASAYPIGKFCGTTPPNGGSINSTHNQLYFWFNSDGSVSHAGFEVHWTSMLPVCGGILNSSSDSGQFSSPSYPRYYPHNRDCTWTISVTPGKTILFHFAHLAIEYHPNCGYDYVQVRDGELASSPLIASFCNSTTPGPLQTTGPFATVIFHTDSSAADRGFHITYSGITGGSSTGGGVVGTGCGEALTGDSGVFTTPGYPSDYDHNGQCVWTITVNQGQRIKLQFTDFDVEEDSDCTYDYLLVRDGSDETASSLGTFCNGTHPGILFSSGNQLYLQFVTDESISGRGFSASWSLVCGGTFSGPTGQIASPNYPNDYNHNSNCHYVIQAAQGMRIRLEFSAFLLETHLSNNCVWDHVTIYDGPTEASTVLGGPYCAANRPDMLRSTGDVMLLTFVSDGSMARSGFQATYTAEDASDTATCGGFLTNSAGVIQSPGFPDSHGHGANCTWYITVAQGFIVRLFFQTMDLERSSRGCVDYLEVFDDDTATRANRSMGRFCGPRLPTLTSTGRFMTLRFHSDISIAEQGFSASYHSLNASTACGSTITSSSGVITSPFYPNSSYPNGLNCEWVIVADRDNQINVNITDFHLENDADCRFDYLEFRNGELPTSPLIHKFCGTNYVTPFMTHANHLYIKFKTDGTVQRPGFSLEFDAGLSGCGGDMSGASGHFISPNYPNPYNHRGECFWTIAVSRGSKVMLVFLDFALGNNRYRCSYADYLEIRDQNQNGALIGERLCGSTIPLPIFTPTNKVWVKMKNSYYATRGFSIRYHMSCQNIRLRGRQGVVESPNYPNDYPHQANCSWFIEAPLGSKINISFASFNIEGHSTCVWDKLEFRNGNSTTAPVAKTFCGDIFPENFQSTGRVMAVTFTSDGSVSFGGFRFEYVVDGCWSELTGNSGVITSPNYPNAYPSNTECQWTITVDYGKSVRLNISDFDLEAHGSCAYDSLEVFNGRGTTGPRMTQLCHTQTSPQVLTSTGNVMTLRMRSDISSSGRGFTASYTAIDGGCGGNFSARQGTVMSPNYPQNYNDSTVCEWLITVAPFHAVHINFTDFAIEDHSSCSYDYVKLYDGANTSMPLLSTMCGLSLSQTFYTSSSNQMFIRMRTDINTADRGFSASYETGCGGLLNADNASEIISPNYPQSYNRRDRCVWTIRSTDNTRRVTLTFTHMDMYVSGTCQWGYITVADGIDAVDNATNKYCGSSLPASYTSRGSAITVVFQGGSYPTSGFRAVYSSARSACGGELTADSGTLLSPGYPDNYPPNSSCTWQIHAPPGNVLQLSFPTFALDPNGGLSDDYVEIRSPDVNGAYEGRYIQSSPPVNLTTLHSAWIKFRSNEIYSGTGFVMEWSTIYGGTLEANSGQLASPQYPSRYSNDLRYTWTIIVDESKVVKITFTHFKLEGQSTSSCIWDYLLLTDGNTDTGTEIGRYCGSINPGIIRSTSNVVTVTFVSDGSRVYTGFLMSWEAVLADDGVPPPGSTEDSRCGGDLIATDEWANLTSPAFMSGYGHNHRCLWRITVPEGSSIMANIKYMHLEGNNPCYYDFVAFFNGIIDSSSIQRMGWRYSNSDMIGGKYCGRRTNSAPVRTTANAMSVVFKTDSSVNGNGFRIEYKKACGSTFTSHAGQVTSPGFPNNYPPNTTCTWRMPARNGKTVMVTFNNPFNIASTAPCDDDYLLLQNGRLSSSPPLFTPNTTTNTNGRYCGTTKPQDQETSGNYMSATFVSDGSGSGAGFSFNFTEKSLACGGHIRLTNRLTSRYITSPNYPSNYLPNVDCIWTVIAPSTELVQLDFYEMEIEYHPNCQFDYVEVRDGGTSFAPLLGNRSCGVNVALPSSQRSSGNMMRIRFATDDSVPFKGFNVLVSIATCGGRHTASSGEIASPNYPQTYPANTNCQWIITGPEQHFLWLNFTGAIRLQSSVNCSADSLEIFDGSNSSSNSLFRGCGRDYSTPTIRTSDNVAYVNFISDASQANTGFKLTYLASQEVCGGERTTSTGIISSPNYPDNYHHRRVCTWRIRAPLGRRVTLTFNNFHLERSVGSNICIFDYILVFNGDYDPEFPVPHIGRYCGTANPGTLESSGNVMTVAFSTDGSVAHGGFQATYTTDQEAVCGGRMTSRNGTISSGQGLYNGSMHCIWTIQPMGIQLASSIKINFTRLDLEYHATCVHDKLELREGGNRRGSLVDRFCGNQTDSLPGSIVIPGNTAWMLFDTDQTVSAYGFSFNYYVQNCGGVILGEQGVITSPNYPSNYPLNAGCAWVIRAPEGARLRLTFTAFNFETNCDKDSLQLQNGGLPDSPVIGKYCGTTSPPAFTSQSNEVRLVMITDMNQSASGFRLTYSIQTEGCGGLYHIAQGNMTSPNSPASYPHNSECTWELNVATGYMVALTFLPDFDIEISNPCNDYVEVFDFYPNGTSFSLGRFCNNTAPSRLMSSSTRMQVLFHSNGATNGHGFRAYWESQCGGLYLAAEGEIMSPNYPDPYPNSVTCLYKIEPPGNRHVHATFDDFELEGSGYGCAHDYVSLSFTHPAYGYYRNHRRFCGLRTPPDFSRATPFTLSFQSDSSLQFRGFKVSYTSDDCGGEFTDAQGLIQSPLFPNQYIHLADCTWNITVPDNMIISLNFSSFNLENHPRCRYDALTIYDGLNTSTQLGQYCGTMSSVPSRIRSTGSSMQLRFISDGSVARTGFSAVYHSTYGPAQGCGGVFRQNSGTFTSLDFDNDGNYESMLDCEWTIYVEENKVATLTFQTFVLEGSTNCTSDYIEIFDGMNDNFESLGKFCGTSIPPVITSATNVIFIRFHTNENVERSGFTASFSSADRLCGGYLNATSTPQNLTSPNYPSAYTSAVRCNWIIDAPQAYSRVEVQVTDLQLAESSRCDSEYLYIANRPVVPNSRNHHHCGSVIPPQFFSERQSVSITYHLTGSTNSRGFQLNYGIASCSRTYTGSGGEIKSPNYPERYPHYLDCDINVIAPGSTYLSLYFYDFHLERHSRCRFDYFKVYDSNGTMLMNVCGQTLPPPVFLQDNQARIQVHSDYSVAYQGFSATFVGSDTAPGCGGNVSFVRRGAITSPNFPSNTSTAMTCDWYVRPMRRYRLSVYFSYLTMADSSRCSTNYVALYNGTTPLAPSYGIYCTEGIQQSSAITINGPLLIRYVNTGGAAPIFTIKFG